MKKMILVVGILFVSLALLTGKADASLLMDGSTHYHFHPYFEAIVYWQVYSPLDVNSPLGSISEYSYLYQIENTGDNADRSIKLFGIDNPAGMPIIDADYDTVNNLDSLSGSVAPSDISSGGESAAEFTFDEPVLPVGSDSYLLYFKSIAPPTMVNGGVQSTGGYNMMGSVPGPAPEPASAMLLGFGLMGVAGVLKRKFMA